MLHWENQLWLNIVLTYNTISHRVTYLEIYIYINYINKNSNLFQLSKLWKTKKQNNRKPSVETLEYQKTSRSKYETFPKIFYSLPSFAASPTISLLFSFPTIHSSLFTPSLSFSFLSSSSLPSLSFLIQ